MKLSTVAQLKDCARSLWPSVQEATKAREKALGVIQEANKAVESSTGVLSVAYLALCQNRPEGVTLEQIRDYVPQGWQSRITEDTFHSAIREANAFLSRFTKADKATKVEGETIGEDCQAYLARFGSIRKADKALKDSLGVAPQTKATKATKAKATKAKGTSVSTLPARRIDVEGLDIRADILTAFREMALIDARTLLAECEDILAKREAVNVVTSKRPSKAKG